MLEPTSQKLGLHECRESCLDRFAQGSILDCVAQDAVVRRQVEIDRDLTVHDSVFAYIVLVGWLIFLNWTLP